MKNVDLHVCDKIKINVSKYLRHTTAVCRGQVCHVDSQ